MPVGRNRSRPYDSASRVLKPLLRVLFAAGLSEAELAAICRIHAHKYARDGVHTSFSLWRYQPAIEDIIARWNTDPSFLEGSKPAPLAYTGRDSFTSLARLATPAIGVSRALSELRRHKLVTGRRNGRLRLISSFFPVRTTDAFDLEMFTKMTVDFLRTHEVNFLSKRPRGKGLFQRIAHRSTSNPKLAEEFNSYARTQGQLLLEAIDDWLARHDTDVRRPKIANRSRVGMGIYLINETLR